MSNSPFLNSIRTDMRQKGYALKTEKTYLHWIKRFILFRGFKFKVQHPVLGYWRLLKKLHRVS